MKLTNKDKRALVNGLMWLAGIVLIVVRIIIEHGGKK